MAQLTADEIRVYETDQNLVNELPVAASVKIFEGAACGKDSNGYVRQLVAGDEFAGFAERGADNSAGANGAVDVDLRRVGVIELTLAGAAITDEGSLIYASDSNTFTLTSTSNTLIGTIIRFEGNNKVMVAFSDV